MIYIKYKCNLLTSLRILSICIFYILPLSLLGDVNNETLEKANKALDQKDFATALKLYKMVEQQGFGDEGMYRNMAYSAISIHAEADAILYLEKSLKYDPNNAKLKLHLEQLRSKNNLDDPTENQSKIMNFLLQLTGTMSLQIIIIIQILIFVLLGKLMYVHFPFDEIGRNARWQFAGLSIMLLLTFCFGSYRHSTIYENDGIIISKENTTIYLSPDTLSPQISKLPLGSKVSYKDHINGWWQIETIYGETGWITSSNGSRI